MFCKKCNTKMKHVMSFSVGKAVEFDVCPKCHFETKKVPFNAFNYKTEKVKINGQNKSKLSVNTKGDKKNVRSQKKRNMFLSQK